MSSDVISRVQGLHRKSNELAEKGHLLRCAELLGRAAEAARALGSDNLVAVDMQRCQANVLLSFTGHMLLGADVDPRIVSARRADCIALFSTVVAALERRRMAGTLLEGKCTAAEEAWLVAEYEHENDAASANWIGPLVGYDTFLRSSTAVLSLCASAYVFAEDCSAAQFQAFAQHVMHTVDLMQQPRSHGTKPMNAEVMFTRKFTCAEAILGSNGLETRLVQPLKDAWQRLQRSGVLEARGMLDEILRLESGASRRAGERIAAVNAAMTAPGLRSCALAGCGAKEAHPQHFKRCSACKLVVYCSKEHQLEAWPSHKAACKAARKAADAAADGAGGSAGSSAA